MPPDDHNKFADGKLSDNISLFGNNDPLIGNVLGGRWELLQAIGEGSMSTAYRAREVQTGNKAVVKVLHQHLISNNKNLKRFEQRAKIFMMLVHPRIGRVYDVQHVQEGSIYLVVEELCGESLEDLLAKSGHLSADHAVDVFVQVCEGLEYAHEQEVLHRDLKPSNIMLVDTGGLTEEVKLVDFGIAKLLADDSDDSKTSGYITRTREVFGSPMYMSPEQCMGKKLDGRSDIYSIGCVMYETLTGKPPFVGKNVLETAYKHMNEQPKSFSSDRPADRYLSRFEAVIFKCLAKDSNDRYQSVSQLKADLELLPVSNEPDWVANAFALQRHEKRKDRAKKRESKRKRRFITFEIAIFVGVSALLAVVVAVWSFSFLGAENQNYPEFNNNFLWVVTEKPPLSPPADYSTKEETAKIDLHSIEEEKGTDSREYSEKLFALIKLYRSAGKFNDATENWRKLIEITRKTGVPISLADEYSYLAYDLFLEEKFQDSEIAALNSLDELDRAGLSQTRAVLVPYRILGDIYSRKGQLDKALDTYEKLYNVVEPHKFQDQREYQFAAARLADIYRRQNKMDLADRYYRLAMEVCKNNNEKSVFSVKVLYGLGLVQMKQGNYKDAQALFQEALPQVKDMRGLGDRSALASAIKKQLYDATWKVNPVQAIMMRTGDATQNQNQNNDN